MTGYTSVTLGAINTVTFTLQALEAANSRGERENGSGVAVRRTFSFLSNSAARRFSTSMRRVNKSH